MQVIRNILRFLDTQAPAPEYMGIFHIIWIALVVVAAITLCILWKKGIINNINKVILITSVALVVLGLYQQTILNVEYDPALAFNYDWNTFPWHFLSTTVCIGIFVGMTTGSINKNFLSYLATYGLLAGLWGMFKPDTFVSTVGLNIYSMLMYGSMIVFAVLILYTQKVRVEIKTFLKSIPVLCMLVGIAISFNEIFHLVIPDQKVSMFSISRHYASDTPIYSLVHNSFLASGNEIDLFEYIICVLLYIALVSAFALIPLLVIMCAKKLLTTDFDVEYEKNDTLATGIRKSEGLDAEVDTQEIFKFRGKVNSKKNTYMQTYFKNLHTNFGNNTRGSCGYVAAAMLLSYYDTILSDKIVPRQFDKVTISHNEPNLNESPGSRFYQPAYDPESISYKDYLNDLNTSKNSYLHECLIGIAIRNKLNNAPKNQDSSNFDFGSTSDDTKRVIQSYLKNIAKVKKSAYDIHVQDNCEEMNKAPTREQLKAYSDEIRNYAIRKVKKGYPVLLGIHNGMTGHAVIAYDYDKKADKLYCHFGYVAENYKLLLPGGFIIDIKENSQTHLTPEECGYNLYTDALVLEFDESKISHTHTNNYEVVVNGALFYYCPDGTYTTSDDLIVEFGKGKQDLIIKGVYGKYRKSQLTIPESIGNVWVSKISKRSFENQDSLRQVVLSCKIPGIPKKAFENCELLTTVVIPESVTKIGSEALGECPALTSIMYLGTKAQWHEIKKHRSWDRKTGNYRVYCVDGVLPKIHARGQGDLL